MMKKIVTSLMPALLLATSSWATQSTGEKDYDETLIVGCRPWDRDLEGPAFKDVRTAHYLDFMTDYNGDAPAPLPAQFHHVDINAQNADIQGLNDFASGHLNAYQSIVIDFATYQHVRRGEAWSDFAKMLKNGGQLVVPVSRYVMAGSDKGDHSLETAKKLVSDNLQDLFASIDITSETKNLTAVGTEILTKTSHRNYAGANCPEEERFTVADKMNFVTPQFIIAKKAGEAVKSEVSEPAPQSTQEESVPVHHPWDDLDVSYKGFSLPSKDQIHDTMKEMKSYFSSKEDENTSRMGFRYIQKASFNSNVSLGETYVRMMKSPGDTMYRLSILQKAFGSNKVSLIPFHFEGEKKFSDFKVFGAEKTGEKTMGGYDIHTYAYTPSMKIFLKDPVWR